MPYPEQGFDNFIEKKSPLLEEQITDDTYSTSDMTGEGLITTGEVGDNVSLGESLPTASVTFQQTTLQKFSENEDMQTSNFVSGSVGWRIKGNGDVEFCNGVFRGSLTAATIDIGTGATSFHVDINGNLFMGGSTFGTATFTVTNAGVITATSGTIGGWTLGTTTLSATTITLDAGNQRIRSSNYVAGVSGFTIESTLLEAENIVARGIMKGTTFQYDVVSAVGGQLMVANADTLASDMTALDASTLTIKGSTTFSVNDILLIRAVTNSGIQEEWFRVTDATSAPTYVVTRDLAGTYAPDANPTWKAGTTVVKQGMSNGGGIFSGGWLRLFGEGTNSPYYSVYSRTGAAYNAYSERVRLGNLNGIGGQVVDTNGIFIGDYSAGRYLMYDDVSGNFVVAGGASNIQTFTSDGTWNKPIGASFVRVVCIGAGGGGGGGTNGANAGGSGGGGGSYVERVFVASDLTDSVTVTVPTGGTAGSAGGGDGGQGGNSSFGAYLVGYGGGGGIGGTAGVNASSGGSGAGSAGAGNAGANNAQNTGGVPASTAGANGIAGQGAGGNNGANGANAEFGGGAGGGTVVVAGVGKNGGSSIFAGAGGGGAGNGAGGNGGVGGTVKTYTAGGGGSSGATGASGSDGGAGADGNSTSCGSGGGAGGSATGANGSGGKGGVGGAIGGGGGGGGHGNGGSGVGGAGGKGGRGEVRVYTWN